MISGQVKKVDIDQNGNIRVETEYTLTDGTKTIGHTRYNFLNYSRENIEKDIKSQCENSLRKTYALKAHQDLIKADITDIGYQCSEVEIMTKPPVYSEDGKTIITPAETLMIDDK